MSVFVLTAAPHEVTAQAAKAAAAAPAPAKPAATASTEVPEGGMPRYIRPETPEQRRDRLGTQEDPGINPDPNTVWFRFGRKYKIERFDKRWAKYVDQPGFVKPLAFMNFTEELYQENDKYVWAWIEEIDTPAPSEDPEEEPEGNYRNLDASQIEYLDSIRHEFSPLEVPPSTTGLRFESASNGLPVDGSWRNSLAVADMNGDGHVDIVLPPERAGRIVPSVFLGDSKGNWKFWATKWPARLNYGSVVAADFNKDKVMDLAFGVHLSGVVVLLHDGKGNFREVQRITNYPTRRILARDVDADGWMDVVAISEGPLARGSKLGPLGFSNLRAYLNRDKGEKWEGLNIAEMKQRVSGDWLASGEFNGDAYPDFVGSNVYFNGTETMYLSKGPKQYELVAGGGELIPFRSYYWATTAGRFTSRDRDDAIVSFTRRWVPGVDPKVAPPPPLDRAAGLDRISWNADGTAKRTPIVRWGGKGATSISGLSHGDFDGDGKEDIIYTDRLARRFNILLGDGKGGFRAAQLEGLDLGTQRHYDIMVADVNADKRPDVIMMYEAESGTSFSRKNGKVEVFLNRGTTQPTGKS
ncbi:MAG TPA: VCBS repeat-containing protein [Thermoanaerobaculia bacterium]